MSTFTLSITTSDKSELNGLLEYLYEIGDEVDFEWEARVDYNLTITTQGFLTLYKISEILEENERKKMEDISEL